MHNPDLFTVSVTIASGASLSGAAKLQGLAPVAVIMSAGWDAADITFQGSMDGTNFYDMYDISANVMSSKAAAAHMVVLTGLDLLASKFLKVRSGTPSSAVNQNADRVLTIISKAV